MHTLLSGKPAFMGSTEEEIKQKIIEGNLSLDSSIWEVVTDEAKDLVKWLLSYDSDDRPSAADAIKHVWFQKDKLPEKPLDAQMLDNLIAFSVTF